MVFLSFSLFVEKMSSGEKRDSLPRRAWVVRPRLNKERMMSEMNSDLIVIAFAKNAANPNKVIMKFNWQIDVLRWRRMFRASYESI